MSRKVVITGGSGFLGSRLSEKLLARGFRVVSLDMQPPCVHGVEYVEASILDVLPHNEKLADPYAVVNLAGKSIFGRWTEKHMQLIYDTRVRGTEHVVAMFAHARFRPHVFVSASAVGWYGDRGDELLNEQSSNGRDFLAMVAVDWEAEARKAEQAGVRTVIIRNGHILGASGGMVPMLLPLYQWGVGGPLGSGSQFFPWIHIDDCVDLYIRAIEDERMQFIRNAVAGEPITNKEFSRTFARTLFRPHIFRIPIWALRMRYKGFADAMVTSQRVTSLYARKFKHADIGSTLKAVLK